MITGFRHERQKRAAQKRWLAYAAIFVVALIFLRTPLSVAFSSFFATLARPFWVAENSALVWAKDVAQHFSLKQSLIRENARLNDALDSVLLEAYSRERLRAENEELKTALGRADERELLLARVLATPGRSPYDTLVIDVGSDHGLREGMKVSIDGDFAVGAVSRVAKKSAVVELFSSYGNELSVTVGTSSLPAIAKGEGGGNFRITLPKGVSIAVDDLVAIPSFAPQYIGAIEAIEHREGGSLQDLYIRVPFNTHELVWVFVDTLEELDKFSATE